MTYSIFLPIIDRGTMAPQTIIPAQFIKVTSHLHNDAAQTRLVCGINMNSGTATGEAYKVTRNNVVTLVGRTTALGKDDSIAGVVYSDGTVVLDVSEADGPNGAGATCAVRTYSFPGAFPPSAVPTTGSGGSDASLRTHLKTFLNAVIAAANTLVKAI